MRLGYALVSWLSRTAFKLRYGMKITGLENIPQNGKLIIASNHRSNFDPPIIGGVVPKIREIHFFAKEELFKNRIFGAFICYLNAFPVKRGQFDREALQKSLEILDRGEALLFFPEGTRAPKDGFLRAKLGVGWLACLSNAPILPIYIHGSNVDKDSATERPAIRVVIGKAVPLEKLKDEHLRGKEQYQDVSDKIIEIIRNLSLKTPDSKVVEKAPIFDRDIIENQKLR